MKRNNVLICSDRSSVKPVRTNFNFLSVQSMLGINVNHCNAGCRSLDDKLHLLNKSIKHHLSKRNTDKSVDLCHFCDDKSLLDASFDIMEHYNTSKQLQSLSEMHTACDAINCKSLQRYHRDRCTDNNIRQEPEEAFRSDFLDSMHCYLAHSFHIGLRYRTNDQTIFNIYQQQNKDYSLNKHKRYKTDKFKLGLSNQYTDHTFMDVLQARLNEEDVSQKVLKWIQIEQFDTDTVCQDVGSPSQSNIRMELSSNDRAWKAVYNVHAELVCSSYHK